MHDNIGGGRVLWPLTFRALFLGPSLRVPVGHLNSWPSTLTVDGQRVTRKPNVEARGRKVNECAAGQCSSTTSVIHINGERSISKWLQVQRRFGETSSRDMISRTMAGDSPLLRLCDLPQGWYNGGEIRGGGRQPRYNGQPANKPLTGGQ